MCVLNSQGSHTQNTNTMDPDLRAEAEAVIQKINSGEIQTVVLDMDEAGEPTLTATPEIMDMLLADPDDAAEILEQVKDFLRQLPPDEDATIGGEQ